MAFNKTPSAHITGITATFVDDIGEALVIPMSSLPDLMSYEVVGDSSDIRKVYFALVKKMYASMFVLPAVNQPQYMAAGMSVFEDTANVVNTTYSFQFKISSDNMEVIPEACEDEVANLVMAETNLLYRSGTMNDRPFFENSTHVVQFENENGGIYKYQTKYAPVTTLDQTLSSITENFPWEYEWVSGTFAVRRCG
jgi:hypothetical protein